MIVENLNNIKKQYQSPSLEVIHLDNNIALQVNSPLPTDPTGGESWVNKNGSGFKKPFLDAPTSENPFGGSSPNYK